MQAGRMRKFLTLLVASAAMITGLSSCVTTGASSIDTRSIDQKILAAREQVEELDTARRMMTRGAADDVADTREIDKKLAIAKDDLVELETARAMMLRGAAN